MSSDQSAYQALRYRSIGPHRGGRVVAVSGVPGGRNTYYFGSTGGGVWKTDDAGTSWMNVSDGYFKYASVGALQVAPSDPNVIYAGMGEATIRGNVSRGDGVYRSTDTGRSWHHLGLVDTQNIGEIAIHPKDPNTVYVAAFGHVWGPNEERGLYRSTDGGETWENALHVSDNAGAIDVRIDPTNPRIVFAATWEADRGPYYLSSGGEGSGIWRSFDGGDSWENISHNTGMPDGMLGKINIAPSPARPGRIYAIVEADDGAVFRSDDYGDTWTRGSEDRNLRQRAWYYHHIYADPQDADTVWVLNQRHWKSIDAGKTFQVVQAPHGDNHDLWINPQDSDNQILGNDGGALVTFNGGGSWSTMYNQATAEFYHVTTDTRFPYRVYGAQQDNTTMSVPSRSDYVAIVTPEWRVVGGGESGYIAVDPENPDIIYAGAQTGRITRYDVSTGLIKNISVWPDPNVGRAAEDLKYRFQWTSPIHLSPHNSQVLYQGGNNLWRSEDEGQSWEQASPDLTRADPETMVRSGGPITGDNTGAETYATISAFAESPVEAGTLWSGSDDGLIWVSRDNGENWDNVTPGPDQLPEWALISIIEASPHRTGTAYVAATRYKSHDDSPYLFRTDDFGGTWQSITEGIPVDDFTRVIRADPEKDGLLFCGTERGMYVSFNDGDSWHSLLLNLPVVPIHDFVIHGNDLVVGTHGRSFWILDDFSILRQLSPEASTTAKLFQPGVTYRMPPTTDFGPHPPLPGKNYHFVGGMMQTYMYWENEDGTSERFFIDAGNNLEDGVVLHYWLPEDASNTVSLTILDGAGDVVRTYSSDPEAANGNPVVSSQAGANRFRWNMRYPGADQIKGGDPSARRGGSLAEGPVAVPGTYQARLETGSQDSTTTFEIQADPRTSTTAGEYQAQFDLLMAIRDKLSAANQTITDLRVLRGQIEGWQQRDTGEDIEAAATSLTEMLLDIEGALIQYKASALQDTLHFPGRLTAQLAGLAGVVASAEGQPTAQSYAVFEDLSDQVDEQIQRFAEVQDQEIAAFNELIDQSELPRIGV